MTCVQIRSRDGIRSTYRGPSMTCVQIRSRDGIRSTYRGPSLTCGTDQIWGWYKKYLQRSLYDMWYRSDLGMV